MVGKDALAEGKSQTCANARRLWGLFSSWAMLARRLLIAASFSCLGQHLLPVLQDCFSLRELRALRMYPNSSHPVLGLKMRYRHAVSPLLCRTNVIVCLAPA